MTQPKHLQTDLDDIQLDKNTWLQAAGEMGLAHAAAANLVLGEAHFGWRAAECGIVASYEDLQNKLVVLLDGARQEFDKIATELRETAASYGRTDTANEERLHSVDDQRQGVIQEHLQGKGRVNG